MLQSLTSEERAYLLLIEAHGAIAFIPSQDAALARLVDLGLLNGEFIKEDYAILQLSPLGVEAASHLSS